jgi:dTDP-4-dehydrorhamnose 3,5-epimerase-like enzyme
MVATGFQVLSTNATILYFLDSVHKPYEDITINPSSCGISWPRPLGAISSRDLQALTLDEYTELLR